MERKFPGLNIYLGCKDESMEYLRDCDNVIPISEMRKRKTEFAHIRELRFDGKEHPLEKLMKECQISSYAVPVPYKEDHTEQCVILSESVYPVRPLLQKQIETLKRIAREKGYVPEVDISIDNAGLVMGVESTKLYEAASLGIQTTLVPTGLGERLYRNMFPNSDVIKL